MPIQEMTIVGLYLSLGVIGPKLCLSRMTDSGALFGGRRVGRGGTQLSVVSVSSQLSQQGLFCFIWQVGRNIFHPLAECDFLGSTRSREI